MRAYRSDQASGIGEMGHASAVPGKRTLTQDLASEDTAAGVPRSAASTAGEGAIGDEQPFAGDAARGGDESDGGADVGGIRDAGAKAGAPAAMPLSPVTISVTQAPIALSQRGSAEYKVKWSVGGGKNGWVIQHVKFQRAVKDATGVAVAARNPALEYWEGWQVRNGAVFIGSTANAHQADTFRTISEEKKTKGETSIIGKVAFVENYNLTAPPWGHSVAAAGALPTMTSAPEGWSDGSAQNHTMRVNYDDIAGAPQTQVGDP